MDPTSVASTVAPAADGAADGAADAASDGASEGATDGAVEGATDGAVVAPELLHAATTMPANARAAAIRSLFRMAWTSLWWIRGPPSGRRVRHHPIRPWSATGFGR